MKKKEKYGDWELLEPLGQGGNGSVWLAKNSREEIAAIKLLWKLQSKAYVRFITEVKVIDANSDIDGILPIINSYLPEKAKGEIPWYVMPVAQTLDNYINGKYFEEIVRAITEVSKILSELHKRNISHRDIKPENLLVWDGKICIGDFGLVDYPDKIEITSSGDVIGAKWTMAPEMRREGSKADGMPADVYSLSKTLWILLTKNKMGFDGQYFPEGVNGLKRFDIFMAPDKFSGESKKLLFTKPLDDILSTCTNDDPKLRFNIHQFLKELEVVAQKITDDSLQWRSIQQNIFPAIVPARVVWEDINDIVKVLSSIGSFEEINHMLYPDGGGLDLAGCKLGQESQTIELLIHEEKIDLVKPQRLVFENLGGEFEWNYFRLETDGLDPTGVGVVYEDCEEVVEISPLRYIDRDYWDEGKYDGEELPLNSRIVCRYLSGAFLIIQKTSPYNWFDMYVGLHNRMNTDEFRDYVKERHNIYTQIILDPKAEEFAIKEKTTPHDIAINYLRNLALKEEQKRIKRDNFYTG